MEKIKVTLTKSLVKIGDTVIHEAGPVLNGKIKVIAHLVSVEQA